MFISDFAIKRPIVTVVSMLALVVFGLIALGKLQTDEFPDVAPPIVTVGIPYPGASPDGVEKEILDPVEEAISSISGVKTINGSAEDGFATIVVEFLFEKPLQEATQDIRDAISGIRSDLPTEMKEPIIKKFNDTDLPIVSLALSSNTLTPGELTRLADPGLTREFRSIPGVAEVEVPGKVERELTVQVKPAALQAAGVGVAQVVQALELQNLAAPVGRVTGDLDERSIRLRGRLERPEEFAQIIIAERNGQVIRLGQVADILDGTEEARSLALFSARGNAGAAGVNRQSVGIDIKKSKGYSTTQVADQVLARLETMKSKLPAGTMIDVVKNRGERVRHSVANVEESLIEGAILTVLVVFLFLNSWRSTVITGLALPVSVLASFVAVWSFGFTLNTMSLLGLSLAIGILIDDAIVVRENIVRHVEMGKDHYTAAREGTDEIGLAVAATTFSIIAVFVPIAFMPGVGGQWFKPFALTMACSVLVSLFVSFSLDPMLSAYWADPHHEHHEKAWITRVLDKFNHWFNRQAQNYKKLIAWALDHRWTISALAAGTFVFALAMPMIKVGNNALVGFGFFPEDDQAELNVTIESPPGSNIEYTRIKADEVTRQIQKHKEVRYAYTTIGGGQTGAVDVAKVYVRLVPKADRDISVEGISAQLRNELKTVGGAKIAVFATDWGGGRKQVQLQARGNNADELAAYAEKALKAVEAVPGAVDVALSTKGQKPELTVDLNRGVAGSIGVTVGQVAQALRPAFAGIDAGDWQDPSGEMRDVYVRLAPESRTRAADLRQLPLIIQGPNGAPTTAPLGQVATVTAGVGPAVINHLNRDKVVSVEFNTSGRSMGEVTADALARMQAIPHPPDIRVDKGGEAQQQGELYGQIFLALGVAVGLMYLILVMQFGSFLDPLAIMLSLPLSLIGVMLGLAVTRNTINIMSLIGVILLMGIVAKNAILLIDFAKWAREKQGLALREALIEAGGIRLRPILMTTVALIAGMLPVALGRGEGAQFRSPLGVSVIGGVITSTVLTLVAIPTFYEILDEWRGGLARRFGMSIKERTAEYPVPGLAPEAGD
ncbi:MAG TPA: efflux RND transporter permease subunit [Gemmatimonadaceae bacterium]|nr:efflux RND transporter permease subunit [Gemmatimonadaceae bacterium]